MEERERPSCLCKPLCIPRVCIRARVSVCASRNCGGDDDTRVVHDDDEEERMSTEPVAPEEVQAVLSALRLFLVAAKI